MLQLTRNNFHREAESAQIPVFVQFSPDRLPGEELEKRYGDKYKFCRVNPEEEKELTERFRLLRLPSWLVLSRGQVIQRISGLPENLEKILESGPDEDIM